MKNVYFRYNTMKKVLLMLLLWCFLPVAFAKVDTNLSTEEIATQLEKQLGSYTNKTQTGFFESIEHKQDFFRQINEEKNLKIKKKLFQVFWDIFWWAKYDDGKFNKESKILDLKTLKILNENYLKDKNWIYYIGFCQRGEVFDRKNSPIIHHLKEADPKTFEIKNNKKILHHDAEIYQIHLSFEGTEVYFEYAQDKNHVYSNGLVISWANPKTYHALPYGIFAKDEDQIFFRNWYESSAPEHALWGVDAKSFEILDWWYARDKNHVYAIYNCWGGSGRETCIERIEKADPKSFKVYRWENESLDAYDKNALYLKSWQRVEGGDLESFEEVGECYAKDKHHVYGTYCWSEEETWIDTHRKVYPIEKADPKTFELVCRDKKDSYCEEAKDKHHVYSECKIVTGEKPSTFDLKIWTEKEKQKRNNNSIGVQIQAQYLQLVMEWEQPKQTRYQDLGCGRYYLDTQTNEIFFPYWDRKIQKMQDIKVNTTPKSFHRFGKNEANDCNDFAYDEQGLIYKWNHFPLVDTGSLELSFTWSNSDGYYSFIRDKNQIFLLSWNSITPQPQLDRATFKAFSYSLFGEQEIYEDLFVDKNQAYWITTPLTGFTIEKFTPLWRNYFKDDKAVYYRGKKAEKADPKNFHTIGEIGRYDAYDNKNYYKKGECTSPSKYSLLRHKISSLLNL